MGCSSSTTLDDSSLQTRIADAVPGAEAASCPDGIDVESGDTFECTVDVGGEAITVRVTQGASRGQIAVDYDERLVSADDVETALASRFEDDLGVPSTVLCGTHDVVVLPVGASLDCEVIDERGVSRFFDVTVGEDGTLDAVLR